MIRTACVLPMLLALWLPLAAQGQEPATADPAGVLLKPIPDRLVVLTFDDAPASHATVVAPILKEMGFGGSFYVCDFDSFKTRKDWYLTYRQMNAMHADGFEIGNHTVGHYGGYEPFLAMEDQVFANDGPRMTTLCWPVYDVNWDDCPKLAAHGYTFGRGGHERTYRPTEDNPFDVPSFTIRDGVPVETFIKQAQQACQGRVVVFCFHGVPDLEHPQVGLEPATFRAMMQYLKDNIYQCIALRDMAEYIDPVKAAAFPRTADTFRAKIPGPAIRDDKPYIAPATIILGFAFPGFPSAEIKGSNIRVTVPFATDLTALAPEITLLPDSTSSPASGAAADFTSPQSYTVTSKDGARQSYEVTVTRTPVSKAKELTALALPGPIPGVVSGTRIGLYVPPATVVTALAPTFKRSEFATVVPPSGTVRDFTTPQAYTVTAPDGSSQVYTVTVVTGSITNILHWSRAEPGRWSEGSRWNAGTRLVPSGRPDYVLNFNTGGKQEVINDMPDGFQVNQLNFEDKFGLNLSGRRVSLVANPATGSLPRIHVNTRSEANPVRFPIELTTDAAVDIMLGGRLFVTGQISGPGSLTINCPGSTNNYQNWGLLRLERVENTYTGGTIINGGQIFLLQAEKGFGTGPVTLNDNADIRLESRSIRNPLIVNGGTLEGGTWDAPITLNGTAMIAGPMDLNRESGGISGRGGITKIGPIGPFSRVNQGELSLWGTNTYEGPTIVRMGSLTIRKAVSLYNADGSKWSAERITVHPGATLCIPAGGPAEFTGAQVGTLLNKLTAAVHQNGLMAGAVFCVDTANATGTVTIAASMADAQGPGGGPFVFRKTNAGTLQLSGSNTYTGQTILEEGTLSAASFNRVAGGWPSSSLGAPTKVDDGEIVIGKEKTDSDCALIYTGTGETTDRVINLAGKDATVTFHQSGSGLLKFSSPLLISGYGANKVVALAGDTAGTGEFAGSISNPHDRTGKATTAITKTGTGKWTLSGSNTCTGPITISQGTLCAGGGQSLGAKPNIAITRGGNLELNFKGQVIVSKLTLDGKPQPPGSYSAASTPGFLTGTGILHLHP